MESIKVSFCDSKIFTLIVNGFIVLIKVTILGIKMFSHDYCAKHKMIITVLYEHIIISIYTVKL